MARQDNEGSPWRSWAAPAPIDPGVTVESAGQSQTEPSAHADGGHGATRKRRRWFSPVEYHVSVEPSTEPIDLAETARYELIPPMDQLAPGDRYEPGDRYARPGRFEPIPPMTPLDERSAPPYGGAAPRSRRMPPTTRLWVEQLTTLAVSSTLTVGILTVTAFGIMLASGSFGETPTLLVWVMGSTLLAVGTLLAVLVVGLPFRLVPAMRRFWLRFGELIPLGIITGLGLVVISFVWLGEPRSILDPTTGQPIGSVDPDWSCLIVGWFVLAFSTAHLCWPARWRRRRRAQPTQWDAAG